LEKTKILIFGGISKFCLWADFGRFWAEIAALTVVEIMPEPRLKSSKPHNSYTMNPNATWSISLESSYPYLQPQEVSKAPTTSCTYSSLPKSAKSCFGCLRPLEIKWLPFLKHLGITWAYSI
jgi:hypothetical protein